MPNASFVVKLVVVPALIAVASLVGRRWGPRAGGWFVALPLTSGPTILLLTLERGPAFAHAACVGALLATISLSAFALAYGRAARRLSWAWSTASGCAAYVVSTALLSRLPATLGWTCVAVCAILAVTVRLMPAEPGAPPRTATGAWDIPLRMVLAAVLITTITALAATVGPRLSGLLTPLPIATTILAAFTHRSDGGPAASQFLRSLVIGLFSYAVFVFAVGVTVGHWPVVTVFTTASVATLAMHGVVWRWMCIRDGIRLRGSDGKLNDGRIVRSGRYGDL